MKRKKPTKEYKIKAGENILYWRKLKGFKQEHLAEAIGISTAALSNIENGISKPHIERLEDIADALGIEVAQLLMHPQQMLAVNNNQQTQAANNSAYQHSGADRELLHRFATVMEKITTHLISAGKQA